MHKPALGENIISLDLQTPIWTRFYMVAPLVVIGTKEGEGYDMAPKHMAMPMGWNHYFGFVCTPRHATYHNAKQYGSFTVSFPFADQVLVTTLTASQRSDKPGSKPVLKNLATLPAEVIDGVFLEKSYLFLECNLDRIIDGFGVNSLIIGEIVAAHVDKQALRESGTDDQQLINKSPLLTFLPPDRFAIISNTLAYPFPANFEK